MAEDLLKTYRVDRTKFEIRRLGSEPSDVEYWLSRPPAERFAAVELMRQINYGKAATSGRLQRVLEIVERGKG